MEGRENKMEYAKIIDMHIGGEKNGTPSDYFYLLEERLPFDRVRTHALKNESLEQAREHYQTETHWLACWGEKDPLPGVTPESLAQNPEMVSFQIVSSRYYEKMKHFNLEKFRNITVQNLRQVKTRSIPK